MKLNISIIFLIVFLVFGPSAKANIYENILKQKVMDNKHFNLKKLNPEVNQKLAKIGEKLFEDEALSFNSSISCKTCHLDEFSSTDGLPNAIGVGGKGKGESRLSSGGLVIPRNVLPLWGRGIEGFQPLFWDGKVELVDGELISQFLENPPSSDPLTVAAHLPLVEIREMVIDDELVNERYKKESVDAGYELIEEIISREQDNPNIVDLANFWKIEKKEIKPIHLGKALAEHIKNKFRLRPTELDAYMNGNYKFSKSQVDGGLLFFGKGKCVSCHSGPLLSDLKFHVIAFPQAGFGKNGFGIDYGRYNVTDKPSDLYKFRTPPLIEVANTGPYGHSGSVKTIKGAIKAHFDPLSLIAVNKLKSKDRVELTHRLQRVNSGLLVPYLDEIELEDLENFLKTLSFQKN